MKNAAKLFGLTLVVTCLSATAADQVTTGPRASSAPQGQTSPNVENTSINERDKGGATKTPQTQPNNAQDRKLLAAVRRAIVNDKSLSTMAHNVKIVVEGGIATLRGPVKSAEEKAKLESLAKNVKGITNTDNQLDVKTSDASK